MNQKLKLNKNFTYLFRHYMWTVCGLVVSKDTEPWLWYFFQWHVPYGALPPFYVCVLLTFKGVGRGVLVPFYGAAYILFM